MKAGAIIVCLVGIAGLWAIAFWWPKLPPELPEKYRGTFDLVRFEPPPNVPMTNPYPEGQRWRYTFRAEGSYVIQIHVQSGFEMARLEGVVTLGEDNVLTLRQVSQNRELPRDEHDRPKPPPSPESFKVRWVQDNTGRYLVMTQVPEGHQLFLRPVTEVPEPAPN